MSGEIAATIGDRYSVEREIGRGGMAVVYLARDTKHDRLVAIKVLDPDVAAALGAERFLSEIRVTAHLQHPNLLPLFDSGTIDGRPYYVMPYVEGDSLRSRLDRERQLPVADALHIATAIAHALDAAHAADVIHRDLKPENVLLRHGQPVVADFGIALAIANAGGDRLTQTGLTLGTPRYMSPEQATAERRIDGRSDLYSLGVMLYEMLAGQPPHVGATTQATIARIITEPPRPVRELRPSVPANVEQALERVLAKVPADRYESGAAFVRALEGSVHGATPRPTRQTVREWLRQPASAVAVAAVVMLAVVSAWHPLGRRATTPDAGDTRTVRFSLAIPLGTRVQNIFGHVVAFSPDARRIAYAGEGGTGSVIWVRDLDQNHVTALATAGQPEAPTFTPDGKSIVFRSMDEGRVYRMPVAGGPRVALYESSVPSRVTFLGADTMLFSRPVPGSSRRRLFTIPLAGGTPAPFIQGDGVAGADETDPYVAPDGRTVFFAERAPGKPRVLAYAMRDERRIVATPIEGMIVLGYASGRLIYVTEAGAIMTVAFDLAEHAVRGTSAPTGETTRMDIYSAKAFLSSRGDLVFLGATSPAQLLLADRRGSAPLIADEKLFTDLRYSPDGSRIALAIKDAARTDIWMYTVASRTLDRLTTAGTINDRPEWTSDGRDVLYRTNRDGPTSIYRQRADGSGAAERISPPGLPFPAQEGVITPDGKTMIVRIDGQETHRDIYRVALDGTHAFAPLIATAADEIAPAIAPNGKWIAYTSNETGDYAVYVRAIDGSGRTLVSAGAATEPLWSRDGKRLVYRQGDAFIAATLAFTDHPTVARRDTVLVGAYAASAYHQLYDISPSDGRLAVFAREQRVVEPTVILNWTSALAQR